ncbi:hypothetical protein WEI85_31490 [Actinomycetes bacterium KLBMP 9797]
MSTSVIRDRVPPDGWTVRPAASRKRSDPPSDVALTTEENPVFRDPQAVVGQSKAQALKTFKPPVLAAGGADEGVVTT